MLMDLQQYNQAPHKDEWKVVESRVGYQYQDSISFKLRYGYKTLFAHYHAHYINNGEVSSHYLEESKAVYIDCALFSYAEIPNYFALILGVTGTLKDLSSAEMSIVRDVFRIVNFTYSPSVYEEGRLKWRDVKDRIMVEHSMEALYD